MDEQRRESWQRALDIARRVLAELETQIAGYTALTVPPTLIIGRQEKQKEIARLESLLVDVGQDGILPFRDTLPRRVSFFGREKEIARALEALSPEDRGWGLMIDGIGGIGKTALAVEVAYLCLEQARFDAFFFTTAKLTRLSPGGEQRTEDATITLDAMLSEIARVLGQQGVAQQAGAEKRRGLLNELRRFSGPERRVLLIFDNLETLPADEQMPLSEFLRRLPQNCKAIVTSRRRAGEGAVWLRLEKLDWKSAKALIADQMQRDSRLERTLTRAGEARWQELHDATGGSPLALHWILGLMQMRNLSLDRALELLRSGAADDSPLHTFIYREAREDMGADDWRVLGALSLFAAPASFEALTSVTDLNRLALESALERLDTCALVDAAGPDGPYSLHPLTRQLAAGELVTQPEITQTLQTRFVRYWVSFIKQHGRKYQDAYRAYDRFEVEWPNLEAAADILRDFAGVPGILKDKKAAHSFISMTCTLRNFLWFRGYWDERLRLGEWAYEMALALGGMWNAGWRAYEVARVHTARNDLERATTWVNYAAEVVKQGARNRGPSANRLLGLMAEQRGDLDEAQRLLSETLAVDQDLGYEMGQATVLVDLGNIAGQRRDYDRAQECYLKALEIYNNHNAKAHQPLVYGKLGNLALARGQPTNARSWFKRELLLAQEVGREVSLASAQAGLARVLEEDGRPAEALSLAEDALQIHERLRHRDLEETHQLVARLRKQIESQQGN